MECLCGDAQCLASSPRIEAVFDALGANSRLTRRQVKEVLDTLDSIPEGAMRVAPGSDAVVWRINPDKCGEL